MYLALFLSIVTNMVLAAAMLRLNLRFRAANKQRNRTVAIRTAEDQKLIRLIRTLDGKIEKRKTELQKDREELELVASERKEHENALEHAEVQTNDLRLEQQTLLDSISSLKRFAEERQIALQNYPFDLKDEVVGIAMEASE